MGQATGRPQRSLMEILGLFVIFLVLIMIGFLTFHPWLGLHNSDGATFYILGYALTTGKGYVLWSLPDPEPSFTFPPLYPAMLAGLMKIWGTQPIVTVPVAKWFGLSLFAASLLLYNRAIRSHVAPAMALIMTLLLAVNGSAHRYLGDILSDIPYLFFTLLTLGAYLRYQEASNTGKRKNWLIATLVLLALTIYTRPIGLALGAALFLAPLLKKQWKPALAVAATCIVAFGSWAGFEHTYRATHNIGDPAMQAFMEKSPVKLAFMKYFAVTDPGQEDVNTKVGGPLDFTLEALHRVEQYTRMITYEFWPSDDVVPDLPDVTKGILMAGTAGLLIIGTVQIALRYPVVVIYTFCYLGILITYPYVSGRYLIPIMPFLILMFFGGLQWFLSRLQRLTPHTSAVTNQRRAAAVITMIATLALVVQLNEASGWWAENMIIKNHGRGPLTSTTYNAFFHSLEYLRDNPPDAPAVIITRKPEITYFYTGIKAKRYPFYAESDRLFNWLIQQQAEYQERFPGGVYVIEDMAFKESRKFLAPALASNQNQMERIYEGSTEMAPTRIWKLTGTKSQLP